MKLPEMLRLGLALVLLSGIAGLFPAIQIQAQETPAPTPPAPPKAGVPEVRQLFVPMDKPGQWPQGQWEAVPIEEYQRLLTGLKPVPETPPAAAIRQGQYRAVFTGERLQNGQCDLQIVQSAAQELLPLDPINLPLTSLAWEGAGKSQPAAWGNAPSGRTLVLLPRFSREAVYHLHGNWSVSGRVLSHAVKFELHLAPAAVNELELVLPDGWRLSSSAGLVEGPVENSSSGNTWKVMLGSGASCELTLTPTPAGAPLKPLLLAESDTTYQVRERELQIEARYELQTAFQPVSQVVFQVPRSIRVYSVSYGGDAKIRWQLLTDGPQQQVLLSLPDPLEGKSRPIRIQGLARTQSGRAWVFPRISCPGAFLVRGESHLTVEAPLELRSYELEGFRETAISVQPDQRETLSFSQILPDSKARFTAFIGTPMFSASAQLVSYLTTGSEEWQMRTEIHWTAKSGSRYVGSCEVQPGWEILDVRRPSETASPVISDWRLTHKEDRTTLTIEFLDALTPMQSKRVQVLARRLPLAADQTLPLACLKPISGRNVEQFLTVNPLKGELFQAAPGSGIATWKGNPLPGFVQNSSLLPLQNSPPGRQELQSFYASSLMAETFLTLNRSESPYNATASTVLELTPQQIQSTIVLAIQPLESPVDRLTLIAPGLGAGWTWEIAGDQPTSKPLAEPQPVGDSGPGSPNTPSLWELQLPGPQMKPFRITAKRQRPSQTHHEVVLPFLPTARDFQGSVEVAAPAEVFLDVETAFAEEERLPEPASSPAKGILRRWHYQSPDTRLTLHSMTQESARRILTGRLELSSLLNEQDGTAIHRARYRLEPQADSFPFSFRLPEGAKLIDLHLAGNPVTAIPAERSWYLPALPPDQSLELEVRYRTAWEPSGLISSYTQTLPTTEVSLIDFRWRFALSPDLQLTDAPEGLVMMGAIPQPGWSRRFFGPLGMRADEPAFLPWYKDAWTHLWNPASPSTAAVSDEFFPAGWTILEAQSPRKPEQLSLTLWNASLAHRGAWMALLLVVAIGVVLRLCRCSFRRQLGYVWALANLTVAGLFPFPWAIFAGACLAGTLLALLFPRRLLSWQKSSTDEASPLGSTASFQHQPVITPLFLLGLGLVWLLTGQPRWAAVYGQSAPSEQGKPLVFNVLVPVDNPLQIRGQSPVVYVDRDLLATLKAAQPELPRREPYLIASADYSVKIDAQRFAVLEATFRVLVLDPGQTVKVHLPMENVYLGGPGHCLVDGVEWAVQSELNTPGFLVELPKQPTQTPAIADKPASHGMPIPAVAIREIRLRLQGLAEPLATGGQFKFSGPAIANCQFFAQVSEEFPSLKLIGANGVIATSSNAKSLNADAGNSAKFLLRWYQKPTPLTGVGKHKATVYAMATIHPLWIEWQIRAKIQPQSELNSQVWRLPPNSLVRDVLTSGVESFVSQPNGSGPQLLLEFSPPRSTEFTLEISATTPWPQAKTAPADLVKLPPLDLFQTGSQQAEAWDVEYQIGIASTPEFSLGPADFPASINATLEEIPVEKFFAAFRQATTEKITAPNPLNAWKVFSPVELPLAVVPRKPAKRVWLNQEGQITEQELKWTVNAEIQTSGAKSFRHVLIIPNDFLIDAVSVQEDETERLVRWAKTGSRLELILSDGTTGIQNVSVTGWIPFAAVAGQHIPLPMFRPEEAELVDSRLLLYQSRAVNVQIEVLDAPQLDKLPEEGMPPDASGQKELAYLRINDANVIPQLKVQGPIQDYRLDRAIMVAKDQADQLRITTLLRPLDSEQPQRWLHLHLPAELTREFRVESLNQPEWIVPYQTIARSDDSLELLFPAVPQSDLGILKIEAFVDAEPDQQWIVPEIAPLGGKVHQSFLAIPAELALRFREDAEIRPLSPEQVPKWLSQNSTEIPVFELPPDRAQPFQLESAQVQVDTRSAITGLQTRIWMTDRKHIAGKSLLQLPVQGLNSLTWSWPEGLVVDGLFLAGKPLSPVVDSEHRTLAVLLPSQLDAHSQSGSQRLELHWSQPLATALPRFGQLEFLLPKPLDIPIQDATLTLVAREHAKLVLQHGIVPMANGRDLAGILPADDSEWQVSVWIMDDRAETALLFAGLLLVLGGVAHWSLKRNAGDWMHRHPGLASGLLGAFWWGCLTGSALGFFVLAFSPFLARMMKPPTDDERGVSAI